VRGSAKISSQQYNEVDLLLKCMPWLFQFRLGCTILGSSMSL
jgi:hypothetical protein